MKLIKNAIISLSCLMIFVLPVSNSHAMLGGAGSTFTVASALYLAGGGTTILGSFVLGAKAMERAETRAEKITITILQTIGVLVGIVLMGEDDNEDTYTIPDTEFALSLNISKDELRVYIGELADLNAIAERIKLNLSEEGNKENIGRAIELLNEYGSSLSKETLKVGAILSGVLVESSKRN